MAMSRVKAVRKSLVKTAQVLNAGKRSRTRIKNGRRLSSNLGVSPLIVVESSYKRCLAKLTR
jgi:hypothetical protein